MYVGFDLECSSVCTGSPLVIFRFDVRTYVCFNFEGLSDIDCTYVDLVLEKNLFLELAKEFKVPFVCFGGCTYVDSMFCECVVLDRTCTN